MPTKPCYYGLVTGHWALCGSSNVDGSLELLEGRLLGEPAVPCGVQRNAFLHGPKHRGFAGF
eukprot:CAMPEP_0181477520 /NCGR_PEP_ID=MMETSP1110-20121109/42257_1 /TAXON_ID=174948 /ORGANISM="Symbiodinium sp., Strain CCMP421" /LENGTH=61 /DNA_ID=CAMNT_0023602821 /DNA_START=180 /DNA_END=362 /DNA_ORIENTATION=-